MGNFGAGLYTDKNTPIGRGKERNNCKCKLMKRVKEERDMKFIVQSKILKYLRG